jgi:SpoVK/Ycf46/Vps4 family AAA+-type ATPase
MIFKRIQDLLQSRASLIYLISEEEERVERIVSMAAEQALGQSVALYTWSCLDGLRRGKELLDETRDPVKALDLYTKVKDSAPLFFKDFHLLVHESPELVRRIKDCSIRLRPSRKAIFFVCPQMSLPLELLSLFRIEDVPLPRFDELSRLLDACIDARPDPAPIRKSLTPDLKEKMVRASMGFTANEAVEAFRGALVAEGGMTPRCVDLVLEEKKALIEKSGVLEFVGTDTDQWEIGGLNNLKKWLRERGKAFSPSAAKLGLKPPKGILAMGVSGCGKSLCVKAIAVYWKLPLLRLDMGRVYDGLAGPPEEAMRNGIKTAEAVAPCVLWIDEIEAGLANQRQKAAGGSESRVLAQFLTWMQEKTAPVFVGATANEVEVLPPEILRKGRFDELFYVGLPGKDERKQILSIHMKKRRLDPSEFDMDYLAESTKGFNGAEIEEGIVSAIYESSSKNKKLTEHSLSNALRNVVPLSRTMRERIDRIERWARDRAVKASLTQFGAED